MAWQQLLKYTPYVPFLKLEDVYITGLVAHAAGIKHVQIIGVINTFHAKFEFFSGTQAFLEKNKEENRETAWQGVLKYAPPV